MVAHSSPGHRSSTSSPNIVRLDGIDEILLREVRANARIANNVLAARAGVAPSTSLTRMRALVDTGVITGFHADIDQSRLGLGLEALIQVRVQPSARGGMVDLMHRIARLPGVGDVYLLAGAIDMLVRVSCGSATELRDFVREHLSGHEVAGTETSLVFEHQRQH